MVVVVVVVIGWVGLGGKGWVSSIYNCSWVLFQFRQSVQYCAETGES